ncbi:MAG: MaoC family dehydratase [Elusimicrobia bacterium]|nr:MaoC family dehydratase [Elusimicrobiota bacterium]
MHQSKSFNELAVGDREAITVEITEEMVNAFAMATGDYNPLHVDAEYAAKSRFGRKIVHGVLLPGIISGILGTRLPGLGTVAREMDAKFSRPVFVGETVTAEVELIEKKEKLNMCIFRYGITNKDGKTVVKGKAVVLPKA